MIVKTLLYLYPPSFRREFGGEIACDLEEGTRDAWKASGWAGVCAFWLIVSADLFRTALVQWVRSGWPSLVGASAAWSLSCCVLLARQFTPNQDHNFPLPRRGSEEEMVVFALAGAVLVVLIAVTIIVTCWFWMLVVRRERRRA